MQYLCENNCIIKLSFKSIKHALETKINCYLISFKKVKIADPMLYEQDTNDSENYVNVNSLSYGNQQLASIGETPLRNFYKNSKSIPLKQIKLFGNADYDIGGTNGLIYNYDTPINNFNIKPRYC